MFVLGFQWGFTVSRGNAEEHTIVLLKHLRVVDGRDAAVLGRSVHLAENFLWKGLWDLVHVYLAASLLDTLGLSIRELLDMPVHRVVDDCDLGSHLAGKGDVDLVGRLFGGSRIVENAIRKNPGSQRASIYVSSSPERQHHFSRSFANTDTFLLPLGPEEGRCYQAPSPLASESANRRVPKNTPHFVA